MSKVNFLDHVFQNGTKKYHRTYEQDIYGEEGKDVTHTTRVPAWLHMDEPCIEGKHNSSYNYISGIFLHQRKNDVVELFSLLKSIADLQCNNLTSTMLDFLKKI